MRVKALVPAILLSTAAGAADVDDAWWSRVQQDIAATEYHAAWQPERDAYVAPNRAHGLRATFARAGLRVSPREEASWEWGLSLTGWEEATPSAIGARVEYDRGRLVEWYLNEPRGIEQGFTLLAPAVDDAKEVHLDLALTGTLSPVFSEDGQAIDFATPEGRKVLRYAQLAVADATGRPLRAWMEGISGGIRIAFDATDAVYPVTVDPLATNPAWSNTGTGGYGGAVDTVGDVNGDGYSDVAVSAPAFDNGITLAFGRVYVYHGTASGPSLTPTTTLLPPGPNTGPFYFGRDVGTAGDVNGDGYADVIVENYSDDFNTGLPSRAYVYLGSASGVATTIAWNMDAGDDLEAPVATAGDVNGDGFSDVIVGSSRHALHGWARVFHGSASGLSTTAAWTVEGTASGESFGSALGTAGDVNGDGYADVIVGAQGASNGTSFSGNARVYHGSPSGLATSPSWTVAGTQASEWFGASVGTAGDVNGDGYADVIVGAPLHGNGQLSEGRAFVYLGSMSGLATSAVWFSESNQANARYGTSVSTAGDINGDGYADIVVGAPFYTFGASNQGRAFVHFGISSGLVPVAGWTAEGPTINGHYGSSLATAGDVNGDGFADVIVGSESASRADIFLGSASGLDTNAGWVREGDQASTWLGFSVAGAGDVDGDGYGDILVGAPSYDGGAADEGLALLFRGSALGPEVTAAWSVEGGGATTQLGWVVASAGDVNGDGYADVAVGAPSWSNGQDNEGKASVYLGSPSGLSVTAAWSVESDQANGRFGIDVAPAGDVNGDGYGDLLVGSPLLDAELTDEGKAYLYLGSATGLAASPLWTLEGNQASAQLGYSVGSAGDVNRDGFADVIVGAPGISNGQTSEGRALLYLGSATGLAPGPAWTVEGNQVNAFLGRSVGTAGDVNGDGRADALVGAEGYTNGQAAEGRVWLYLGVASGLAILPVWSAESDQAGAHFGYAAATAGDVNGDGFADVIVGAPDWDGAAGTNAGKVYAFQGNPNGLSLVPLWTVEGHGISSFLGASVTAAGDVNGDGFGDVVVGEPFDDDGVTELDEGTVLLYKGGFRGGVLMRPRQRKVAGTTPLARFGTVDSPDSVRLDLLGRSPFGRGKVRLEWEVKPLGTAFDGTGTQFAPASVDSGVAGTFLTQGVTGLSSSTRYHWRMRLRYDAVTTPFAQRSRWVTVPWGGWNEAMLRTGAPTLAAGDVAALTVAKSGTDVTLSWGASCTVTDTDYEVYEGTLGTWYSHGSRLCTTAGATTAALTPLAGNRYFLVVPRNVDREGSYGRTGAGAERPQGTPICIVRDTGACP